MPENAKSTFQEVVEGFAECRIEVEMPEPDESDLAPVQRLLDQPIGRDGGW